MRLAAQRENRRGHRIGFSLEQVDMIIQALQIKRYGQDASCPYLFIWSAFRKIQYTQ